MNDDPMNMSEAQRLNDKYRLCPKPGDYWNDMFSPVCVVLAVMTDNMVICRDKLTYGLETWEFDLANALMVTRDDFENYLLYKSIPGCWATVVPNQLPGEVKEWEKLGRPYKVGKMSRPNMPSLSKITSSPKYDQGVLDAVLDAVAAMEHKKIYSDKDRGYNKALGHVRETMIKLFKDNQ